MFPVAIGLREGLALRDWVRREGARRTLEVGLGYGVSALFICEGLVENGGDVRHVAIDPFQFAGGPEHRTTFSGAGLAVLEEAGVRGLVEFHEETSQVVLPRLLAAGRSFDLAFVDGTHVFDGVLGDLTHAGRLVQPGGIVFVDDTQLPDVRRALDNCVARFGWTAVDEGRESDAHEWTVLRSHRRGGSR